MNKTYDKVLEKMLAVDPALGEAILLHALKTAGTTPDDVTPQEMEQAYQLHLEKTLNKYPRDSKVKAVRNTINALNAGMMSGKEEARSAAKGSESIGEGHVTTTLYAQPNKEEPHLILNMLKEGKYEAGSLWGIHSVLRFTQVGESFYDAMVASSRKVMLKLDDFSQLEDYKAWVVSLSSRDLSVTLSSVRYRPFASFPAAFYIRVKLDGDAAMARKIVDRVVDRLGYVPYNMNDWAAFNKKTGTDEAAVKRDWGKLM